MKILLLGANGQVGWELQRALAPLGQLEICDRRDADFKHPEQLGELVGCVRPQVIVNAAAYTAVDKAESEKDLACTVNARSVEALACAARQLDALLLHYSTDYVFDGRKQAPYLEGDPVAPLNVYGASKLEGEQLIQSSGCRHLILRTSWVYASRGNNFAATMLRLGADREELRVVADQVGAPTSAALIADVSALLLYRLQLDRLLADRVNGIYHLAAAGETSWHDYARFVIETARELGLPLKATGERILPITSADYPAPAMRPQNSRLDTSKLQDVFGVRLPHWQHHVRLMLQQVLSGKMTTPTS